jgi:hypothetical protein
LKLRRKGKNNIGSITIIVECIVPTALQKHCVLRYVFSKRKQYNQLSFSSGQNPNTCTPTISLKGTPKSTHQKQSSYKKLQIQQKNKENLRGKNPHLGLLPGKHSMNGRGERSGRRV